jgi:hypothetical protein
VSDRRSEFIYKIEKEKILCFAPESMAVLCGMFYTCKAQISNLLINCKQIIEIVLKLKDALLKPRVFLFPVFRNLIPYVTKQGV